MKPAQKLALLINRPTIEAKRVLREHGPGMSASALYDAVLAATGSEIAADAAFNARRRAELKSGQPVDE